MTIENFLRSGVDALRSNPPRLIDELKRVLISPIYFPYLVIKVFFEAKSWSKKSIFLHILFLFAVGFTTEKAFSGRSIQLYFPQVTPRLLEVLIHGIVGTLIILSLFGVLATLTLLFSEDSRFFGKIYKEYLRNECPLHFDKNEYIEAIKLLEALKPTPYLKLLEKHPKRIVDLLILSRAVWCFKGKIQRLVSLAAIKEDRSANVEDD